MNSKLYCARFVIQIVYMSMWVTTGILVQVWDWWQLLLFNRIFFSYIPFNFPVNAWILLSLRRTSCSSFFTLSSRIFNYECGDGQKVFTVQTAGWLKKIWIILWYILFNKLICTFSVTCHTFFLIIYWLFF